MDEASTDQEAPSTPSTIHLGEDDLFSPRTQARIEGVFARLIPINWSAKLSFHHIAERMKLDPLWNEHSRRNIYIEEKQQELSSDPEFNDSESEAENRPAKIWVGHYRLNLEQGLANPGIGWIAGSGRKDLGDRSVDLLLTTRKTKYQVYGRHGRFLHDLTSGAFMIIAEPGKPIFLNGQKLEAERRVISGSITSGIAFGDLAYSMEFTQLSEIRYQRQLRILRLQSGYIGEAPPDFLDATPSEKQFEYNGYLIQAPFAFGAYSVVCSAIRLSKGAKEVLPGEVVAVKRIKRTRSSLEAVRLEVAIYERIAGHDNVCNLIEAVYSDGDAFSMGQSEVNDVYFFHKPIARDSFLKLICSNHDDNVRMGAFLQACRGIEHFHSRDVMHRDVKPENIMVVSYQPLRVVIIDVGQATFERQSKDHTKGTNPYLAPEVISLKHRSSETSFNPPPYDRSCDIWGLGLTGYQLFRRKGCTWGNIISRDSHAGILSQLKDREECPPIHSLLIKMLAWTPQDRPSMSDIVSDPMWKSCIEDAGNPTP